MRSHGSEKTITIHAMTKNTEYLGNEGYALMGAVFEVYKEMGAGMSEEIYQESLEMELTDQNIPFSAQQTLKVYYKGRELKKRYIPDLITHDSVIVELKAVKTILPEHEQQLLNYMHVTQRAVGYLINFGTPKEVQWKRYILQNYIPKA
jgi:GxxExxY protein